MANSHLPNCHPEVTLGWKPYPFERTSLLEAIKTTATSDGSRYAGTVPHYWCASSGQTLSAHGGFCTSMLLSTALQHVNKGNTEDVQFTPLSISVEFLKPLPAGTFEVNLTGYNTKGTVRTIRAEITRPTSESDLKTIFCVSMIKLRKFGGVKSDKVLENKGTIPKLSDCSRWALAHVFRYIPPASSVRMYVPSENPKVLWSPRFGDQYTRYQWTKSDSGEKLGYAHIPVLADIIPPIPLNFEQDYFRAVTEHRTPTLSLLVMFYKTDFSEEWLLSRTTMKKLENGIFDMDTGILDEDGNLVANCVQICARTPKIKSTMAASL